MSNHSISSSTHSNSICIKEAEEEEVAAVGEILVVVVATTAIKAEWEVVGVGQCATCNGSGTEEAGKTTTTSRTSAVASNWGVNLI